MSSEANKDSAIYVKPNDFASKDEFELARLQLASEIKNHNPHFLHSSVRACGNRWTRVLNAIFDDDNGMLRGYRKFKDHRNFRTCFIEKVFSKTQEIVLLKSLAKSEVSSGLQELNKIADIYFDSKKVREENRKKRNETLKKNKETMAVFEDSVNLIPKPAHFEPNLVESPSSLSDGLPSDFGGVKIVTNSNDDKNKKRKSVSTDFADDFVDTTDIEYIGHPDVRASGTEVNPVSPRKLDFEENTPKMKKKLPSTMSTKKVKLNRNMEVVKYFDEQTTHLDSLFKKISEQMNNLPVPQIENEKNLRKLISKN